LPWNHRTLILDRIQGNCLLLSRLSLLNILAHQYFFPSHGLQLHGWLYLPQGVDRPPIIVAGHGFAAQKDFRLDAFAKDFAAKGFATLTFDYRYFGGSEGEPRQLVEVSKLLEDWHAAVDYALNLTQVNTKKIGIWGSSFAGGHVIQVAATHAQRERIGAVISQVPFTDGLVSVPAIVALSGFRWLGTMTIYAIKDMLRNLFGMPRYYAELIGTPDDTTKFFIAPGSTDFWDIIPGGEQGKPSDRLGGWQARVPATIALTFPLYRPVTYAPDVQAPTLVIFAEHDNLCPVSGVREMISKIPHVATHGLNSGHFDAYTKEYNKVIEWELEFFQKHLKSL